MRELQQAHEKQLSHLTTQHDSKVRELQDALQNALSSSSQSEEESQQKTQQLLESIRKEALDKENLWKEEKAKLQQQQSEAERVHSESQAEVERQLGVAQEELKKVQALVLETDSEKKNFVEEKELLTGKIRTLEEHIQKLEISSSTELKSTKELTEQLQSQLLKLQEDHDNSLSKVTSQYEVTLSIFVVPSQN